MSIGRFQAADEPTYQTVGYRSTLSSGLRDSASSVVLLREAFTAAPRHLADVLYTYVYSFGVGVLDADAVVAAGVEVVRTNGWVGLSLRAVAAQLGVTPMALYRHVPDVAALTKAVIESISAGLTEVPRSGDVRQDLWAWAHAARAALSPFPGVAAHLLTVWFEVPSVLGTLEDLLDVAYDGGLDGFEAVAAVNALFMYVLMRAEAEQTVRTAGAVRRSLALAKSHRPLPRLRSLASYYTTAELDRHFEYGLQALLVGIGSRRSA